MSPSGGRPHCDHSRAVTDADTCTSTRFARPATVSRAGPSRSSQTSVLYVLYSCTSPVHQSAVHAHCNHPVNELWAVHGSRPCERFVPRVQESIQLGTVHTCACRKSADNTKPPNLSPLSRAVPLVLALQAYRWPTSRKRTVST